MKKTLLIFAVLIWAYKGFYNMPLLLKFMNKLPEKSREKAYILHIEKDFTLYNNGKPLMVVYPKYKQETDE